MFELYEQGFGTHAVADKTGRSTHTVHSVLTHRGTRCRYQNGTQTLPRKGLIAVPVEVAGEADAGNGTTPVRLTGAGI